jgi:predicted O-methyltransferase YrrM
MQGQVARVKAAAVRRRQRWAIAARMPKRGVGVEIGVYKGDFAAKLLWLARPARLHLVDPWRYISDPDDKRVGRRMISQANMDAIHQQVLQRFARHIRRGRVVVHRAASTEAAAQFGSLDWVYIDANHTYEAVKRDLATYYALLRPGGVLAGDDYGMGGWWGDGVREAVDEFAGAQELALTVLGHQYLLRKPLAE